MSGPANQQLAARNALSNNLKDATQMAKESLDYAKRDVQYNPYGKTSGYGDMLKKALENHESPASTPREPRDVVQVPRNNDLTVKHAEDYGSSGSQQFPWAQTRNFMRYNPFGGKRKRKKKRVYVN